jgi:DnaK suppressor protein
MIKRDALLRLHATLQSREADLRMNLADELRSLRDSRSADSTCDSVDVAFETSSDEMSSQLAERNDRELSQIERALARLGQGTYGVCEGGSANCLIKIPMTRLNALPYTTVCVNCEREMEKYLDWPDRGAAGNWEQVFDWEAPMERRRINLSEMEMSLSSNRSR